MKLLRKEIMPRALIILVNLDQIAREYIAGKLAKFAEYVKPNADNPEK